MAWPLESFCKCPPRPPFWTRLTSSPTAAPRNRWPGPARGRYIELAFFGFIWRQMAAKEPTGRCQVYFRRRDHCRQAAK